MQKENNLYKKAYAFALNLVKICQRINSDKKEFILSKQLLRCGTSIGANIAEANGAISKAEFAAKLSIAYKECLETKYWLSLLKDTFYINEQDFHLLFNDVDELGKISFSSIKTVKTQ